MLYRDQHLLKFSRLLFIVAIYSCSSYIFLKKIIKASRSNTLFFFEVIQIYIFATEIRVFLGRRSDSLSIMPNTMLRVLSSRYRPTFLDNRCLSFSQNSTTTGQLKNKCSMVSGVVSQNRQLGLLEILILCK